MPRQRPRNVGTPRPDQPAAPPRPFALQDFLPYRLSALAEVVSAVFAQRYQERFGLSIPEWRVMAVLGESSPRSTQQVIDRTGMDRVRVSRAVIRLSDKRLLQRHPHPEDQRAQMLSLSRAGREVHGRIVPLAQDMQARLAGALSEAERAELDRVLAVLLARARDMADPGDAPPTPGRRGRARLEAASSTRAAPSGTAAARAGRKDA
jgi:DNA-binding MarR family transcriptional regulator